MTQQQASPSYQVQGNVAMMPSHQGGQVVQGPWISQPQSVPVSVVQQAPIGGQMTPYMQTPSATPWYQPMVQWLSQPIWGNTQSQNMQAPYPPQAALSGNPYQTDLNQGIAQYSYSQPYQLQAPQYLQTLPYNQGWSMPYSQPSQQWQGQQQARGGVSLRNDGWPDDATVLSQYAPSDLNKYACQLEDLVMLADNQLELADRTMMALLPYLEDYKQAELTLQAMVPYIEDYKHAENTLVALKPFIRDYQHAENTLVALKPHIRRYQQMEEILTDPNLLAPWYVQLEKFDNAFDGMTGREPKQLQLSQNNVYQPVERPYFPPMPTPANGDKWAMLQQVPINQAWMVLDRMAPQDWQQKNLVVV